ncbi:MAG: enoyl-CoA hydratase/isomerase family protein [Chitinophagaceae bacterium]|nr:enoyl-CoA hydratase/isomerase family protein [Chitinophagaceae bacterium]
MTTIATSLSNSILTITINRPEKLNALNKTVLSELESIIQDCYSNNEVHGLIITGSGNKAFIAGADISEFKELSKEEGITLAQKGQHLFKLIEDLPKPVIAAVNGFALGGGCELAMCCHIRLASTNAKFGQPEVNLGIIPGYGGTQRLTQLVGKGKSLELILSGNIIDANEALKIGLVNHVFESDILIQQSENLLQTILTKSPQAIAKSILAINNFYQKEIDGFEKEVELFGECFGTSEMLEGVTAFLEKRKPDFRK